MTCGVLPASHPAGPCIRSVSIVKLIPKKNDNYFLSPQTRFTLTTKILEIHIFGGILALIDLP